MKLRSFSCIVLLALTGLWSQEATGAAIPAFNIAPVHLTYGENMTLKGTNGVVGWSFYVLAPLPVTGIGWYDAGLDGLSQAHRVGIWSSGPYFGSPMSLLLDATIPSGKDTPVVDIYRVVDFPVALTLEPGVYTIAGTHEDSVNEPVRFVLAEGIDSFPPVDAAGPIAARGSVWAVGGGFRPPDNMLATRAFEIGPMLMIIPEPSCAALAVAGALTFLLPNLLSLRNTKP